MQPYETVLLLLFIYAVYYTGRSRNSVLGFIEAFSLKHNIQPIACIYCFSFWVSFIGGAISAYWYGWQAIAVTAATFLIIRVVHHFYSNDYDE